MKRKKQTPESKVLNAIGEYLTMKGYLFWRSNNIPVFDPVGKFFRAMPKYSRKGVSDFLMLHKGTMYFIEAKANTKLSEHQVKFKEDVVDNGGIYILATSEIDLIKSGL